MTEITLDVPAIHCQHCARTIRNGLADMEGLHRVRVDVTGKRVTVDYDQDQITEDRIRDQLEHIGFPGTLLDEGGAPGETRPPRALWYGVLTLGVIILALAGYGGYVLYPRFGLSAGEGASLLLLAVMAGIASFFSPCSFPLLLTLMARQSGVETRERDDGVVGGLPFALAVGAIVFFLIAGLVLAAGGEALFASVTFTSTAGRLLRLLVGALLIVLGLIQLERLPVSLGVVDAFATPLLRSQARERRRRPLLGFTLLGFAYPIAGFG